MGNQTDTRGMYDQPTREEVLRVQRFVEMVRMENLFQMSEIQLNAYRLAVSVLTDLKEHMDA